MFERCDLKALLEDVARDRERMRPGPRALMSQEEIEQLVEDRRAQRGRQGHEEP